MINARSCDNFSPRRLGGRNPFLAHYTDSACNPSGSTGSWNAFAGNSGGWQQVEMDLSAYAGKTVELYITYASDWATQGLGVFVDDIDLSGYPLEDFEAGTDGWSAGVASGSAAFNNWAHINGAGFPEGRRFVRPTRSTALALRPSSRHPTERWS